MPKYPNVNVKLIGEDGNAFSIMGRVTQALKSQLRGQYTGSEIADICNQYLNEAKSGNYDNLLVTTMNWVSCDGEEDCDEEEYYENDYDEEDDDYFDDDDWGDDEVYDEDEELEDAINATIEKIG